jgi:hypothetical protein
MRPLFRRLQQPPLRCRAQRPLLPSLRPEDRPSCRHTLLEPQQRLFPVLHLRPEQHPALASQQPPFLLPQQPLHLHRHQTLQQHPFLLPQRRSRQPLQQANQQQLSLLRQQHARQPRRVLITQPVVEARARPRRASGISCYVTVTARNDGRAVRQGPETSGGRDRPVQESGEESPSDGRDSIAADCTEVEQLFPVFDPAEHRRPAALSRYCLMSRATSRSRTSGSTGFSRNPSTGR